MAAFKFNIFSGLRPKLPESLLTNGAATIAQNCDFAYGELRNVKGGFGLLTLSNAASSIYTEDGLSFYSWTTDVNAVRSPMVSDKFNRLYYTGDGAMRVADPEPEAFTPLASVTPVQVVEWIEVNEPDGRLLSIKQHIQMVLDREIAKASLESAPLPWAPIPDPSLNVVEQIATEPLA